MSANPSEVTAELRPLIRAIDLATPRSIHLVGVGGAGMRAIARVLLAMGHRVSGSDRAQSVHLDELARLGATVFVGHAATQITGADFLARSTAVSDDNPEVAAAVETDVPVYSRAEILAAVVAQRPAILVAGTHGKTTTSSMLAVVLDHVGLAPSFIIGSDIANFGTGARWAGTEHFVVEADESDGTFLTLAGSHAVVTSLDPDHLEYYGSPERLQIAFGSFVDSIAGTVAVCGDDPDTIGLLGKPGVVTYGVSDGVDLQIAEIVVDRDSTSFDVRFKGVQRGRVTVGLPGHHNALNAAAAMVVALELGCDFASVAEGLGHVRGVARRYENRGETAGVRFVDDYAHLPAEVEAAVRTAIQGPWRRVIAAYQPHRFSRTEALGDTFATSFMGVDHLVLTDIYPAGEAPRSGITGRVVFDAVTAACPDLSVSWQPTLQDVSSHLAEIVGPGDLCLTLGAGDLTTVPDQVITQLKQTVPSVDWLRELEPALTESVVDFNGSLGTRTTYRVGGSALAVVEVGSRADLHQLVRGTIDSGTPLLPVGNGSNMLVADRGYRGVAIVLTGEFESITVLGSQMTLGAAVLLPVAARRSVAHSLRGFEWAVGVPGSLGGAIVMNAGGHGSDMAASVSQATVLDLATGMITTRKLAALGFGYRTSSIAATELVLDATIELAFGDQREGEAVLSDIVRWRREHQPGGQNAGSVFTNPMQDSAGRLIDEAGGKGLRVHSATVSDKHANFIQVESGGSADDVYALMRAVIALVREDTGVVLEPETKLVGFVDALES